MMQLLRKIWTNPNGRALILFAGMSAITGAITAVNGSGPITSASPTGPTVTIGYTMGIDTGPCSSGAYTIPTSDGFKLVQLSSTVDCTVTLPTSGSPFTTGTGTLVTIQNASNVGAAPILSAGTPTFSGNCGSSSATCAVTYNVANTGDLLILDITSSATTATITSITDTTGNAATCAAVATQSTSPGPFDSQWACPNTSAVGSDIITVHFSATVANIEVIAFEKRGIVTSSPAEVTNTVNQTSGTALNISTSGTPSQRGDFIYGSVASNASTITPLQPTVLNAGDVFRSNAYVQSDGPTVFGGTNTYAINWTNTGSAATAMTIAAYKSAHPVSMLNVCPGSGTTLKGDTTSGCTPLPAGFSADLLWDGTNYQIVKVTPPAANYGPPVDATATFNMSLEHCREPVGLKNWVATIVITVPTGLPGGCAMNMKQIGNVPAQVAVSAGMTPLESLNGPASPNVHTGAYGTQSNITIWANGGTANFGGTTAP